jgi:hypothetical protein
MTRLPHAVSDRPPASRVWFHMYVWPKSRVTCAALLGIRAADLFHPSECRDRAARRGPRAAMALPLALARRASRGAASAMIAARALGARRVRYVRNGSLWECIKNDPNARQTHDDELRGANPGSLTCIAVCVSQPE